MIVTIYKIPNCYYCNKAVILSNMMSDEVVERDLLSLSKEEWVKKIGKIPKTAPQIFIGKQHIGGYDDLVKYYEENGIV